MQLILMRHAEALDKTQAPERPLSEYGQEQAKRMNQFLATLSEPIGNVYHSDKARAQQTAQGVAQGIASVTGIEHLAVLDPENEPSVLLQAIDYLQQNTLLVGHLPNLELVANQLLSGQMINPVCAFNTASAMGLIKHGQQWILQWFIDPTYL